MSKLKRKHYEKLLAPMQLELARMAQWVQHEGKRVVVVFEGRDTAGKGGAIDAVREHLNPRQCRVAALPRPITRPAAAWHGVTAAPDGTGNGRRRLLPRQRETGHL